MNYSGGFQVNYEFIINSGGFQVNYEFIINSGVSS